MEIGTSSGDLKNNPWISLDICFRKHTCLGSLFLACKDHSSCTNVVDSSDSRTYITCVISPLTIIVEFSKHFLKACSYKLLPFQFLSVYIILNTENLIVTPNLEMFDCGFIRFFNNSRIILWLFSEIMFIFTLISCNSLR